MDFDRYIGIDYSGQAAPTDRLPVLQVYRTEGRADPQHVRTPTAQEGARRNWSRKEIAEWLVEQLRSKTRLIAGIDHGFSFPSSYFWRYNLSSWPAFLDDFQRHWPTDGDNTYVEFIRGRYPVRVGAPTEFRLTEERAGSSKSVFRFEGHGTVAKSTHAGIPWLRMIRREVGDLVHFWPLDGWQIPAHKSAIVEVDPSLFRKRYPSEDRTPDQQDAYATARWLAELDQNGSLPRYLDPPLTEQQRKRANLEGWICGVI